MFKPSMQVCRRFLPWIGCFVGLFFGVIPAAAHGTGGIDGDGIGLPLVLAVVVLLGVLAGVLAAVGRGHSSTTVLSRLVGRAVGPLLAGIGGTAVLSVAFQQPTTGVGGAAVGLTAGVLVATRGGCGLCADVTVGAIAVHRLVEGITLAALSVAGSSLGVLAILVLLGHTVAECVALGGQSELGQLRAIGAVLVVEAVFVLGAVLGTVGLVTAGAVPRLWVAAVVGGLLVALGIAELRPIFPSRPATQPST